MDTPAREDGRGQNASQAKDPFRVDDDPPRPPPEPEAAPAPSAPPAVSGWASKSLVVPPPSADGHGVSRVSEATVRERVDPSSRVERGPIAPPAGWPKEMWRFPTRGLGILRLGLVAAVFAAVDALCEWNAWLGWLAKLGALVYLMRFQIRIVSSSASGKDELPSVGLDGTWEEFARPVLGFLWVALLLTAPALLSWIVPKLMPFLVKEPSWVLSSVLVLAPLLYLPVVMLAQALGDLSMKWPHRAIPWVFRGFVACLLVAAGWCALAFVEWAMAGTPAGSSTPALLLHLLLRAGSLYAVAVGGRALGVLGRRYDSAP